MSFIKVFRRSGVENHDFYLEVWSREPRVLSRFSRGLEQKTMGFIKAFRTSGVENHVFIKFFRMSGVEKHGFYQGFQEVWSR